MFFVVTDPFFTLGVEFSITTVTALVLICERVHILTEYVLDVLESCKDLRLDIFGVQLCVIGKFVFENLCGVCTIDWVMTDHLLENVFEEDCRGHLFINIPEVLLALEYQFLVIWVVWMGSAEGLIFHFQ